MKGYSEKTGRQITMDDVMKEFNKDFDEDDAETIGFSNLFKILKAAGLIIFKVKFSLTEELYFMFLPNIVLRLKHI